MLGTLNETHKEATIIGAGFSGLLAAYRLLQRGYRVKLYEAATRAGGLINTVQTQYGMAEAAAHTLRSSPELDALFAELKIPTVEARTKKKFIWRGERMRTFPLTLREAMELGLRALFMPAKDHYDTIAEWAAHHAGKGALNAIFHPMMNGIYAASVHELSPQLVFSKLVPPEGKTLFAHAISLQRSGYKPRVMAPRDGMASFVNALFHAIEHHPNAQVFLNERIAALPEAANVILTTPAQVSAQILQSAFPKSAAALFNVRYAPLIAATVFLEKKTHTQPTGVGVLCAANEPRKSLGVLFNSSTFAGRVKDEANVASYTVMLGGTQNPDVLNLPDAELNKLITDELRAVVKLMADPLEIVAHRWAHAIPVYSPALLGVHETLHTDFCAAPGRMIFGNFTGEISLRGMAGLF